MDNVQLQKSCISKPSSLTFKSYWVNTLALNTKYPGTKAPLSSPRKN
jgi:hypothetical protein